MNLVVRSFSTSSQRIILLLASCRRCGFALFHEAVRMPENYVRQLAGNCDRITRTCKSACQQRQRKMRVKGWRMRGSVGRKAARYRPCANFVPQRFPPLQRFRINYTESNPFPSLRVTRRTLSWKRKCIHTHTRARARGGNAVSIRIGIPPKGRKDRPPGNMEFFSSKNSQESSHREKERERDLLDESIKSLIFVFHFVFGRDVCDIT